MCTVLNRRHQVILLRIHGMMTVFFQSFYFYSATTVVCGEPSVSKTLGEEHIEMHDLPLIALDLIWNCLLSLLAILTLPFNLLQKSSTQLQQLHTLCKHCHLSSSHSQPPPCKECPAENSRILSQYLHLHVAQMVWSLTPPSAGSSTTLCIKDGRVTQLGLATKSVVHDHDCSTKCSQAMARASSSEGVNMVIQLFWLGNCLNSTVCSAHKQVLLMTETYWLGWLLSRGFHCIPNDPQRRKIY